MLCSRPRPLNETAPVPGLPNAQRERPSRVAGSFSGPKSDIRRSRVTYWHGEMSPIGTERYRERVLSGLKDKLVSADLVGGGPCIS